MVEPMREQHFVVAGLLRRRGRALLVHRSPQRLWYPDVWDLPGGHVLSGEPPRRASEEELSAVQLADPRLPPLLRTALDPGQ